MIIKDHINSFKENIQKLTKIKIVTISIETISVIVLIIIGIGIYKFINISKSLNSFSIQITLLENKLSSTTDELRVEINKNSNFVADALNQQKQSVGDITQKLSAYSQEVGSYSSTVSNLQKLSKTDPQLLAKYSKVFFLNENYAPARMTEIPNQYKYSDAKALKLNSQIWPYMQRMIDDANKNNVTIYIFSAYRSFNEQQALKGNYTVTYGAGSANSFSADQGYSEHQLGSTVDLIAPGLGGVLDNFDSTKAYEWLRNNAYKYGFVLSYPKDNKFYVYEPWHWRFVGVKLATDLHNKNKNFYDMDQRDIDEYLINLFD